jgi:hypothetical protein
MRHLRFLLMLVVSGFAGETALFSKHPVQVTLSFQVGAPVPARSSGSSPRIRSTPSRCMACERRIALLLYLVCWIRSQALTSSNPGWCLASWHSRQLVVPAVFNDGVAAWASAP